MKHTPGPWGYFNCGTEYPIFEASTGHFNSEGKGYDAGKGYAANVLATVLNEEDAKIIAAAPDMEDWIKDTISNLKLCDDEGIFTVIIASGKALLKRIEGEDAK